MATSAVKFVSCSLSKYNGLAEHSASTLYFITDSRRIYKGDVPFTGGLYETCTAYPVTGEVNTIYVNTKDGSAKYWNGTAFVTIVKPAPASITGKGSADEQATTKAVVDYVASEISKLDAGKLNDRLTAVEAKAKANEAAIGVINGTGAGSISKALSDAKAYTDTAKTALQGEIDKKATKATTLAGYGIADAYTKEQADAAIQTAVAGAHHLKRQIVTALPDVTEANEDTIYMVGTGEGSETSNYKEYMLVNGKFELVGDSKVDLTDYATKAYADGKANDALTAAKADSLAKIQALDKADTAVADNYVSAVSQTDGVITVTRAKLPVTSIAEGTANGTIAVNGKDVKVHGLGSAAYAETTAFDEAGAAAKAQAAAASDAKSKADAAQAAAISAASADATKKADAALASAKADATTKASAAQAAAEKTAAADATAKANAAQAAAEKTAAADATSKANAAQSAAIEAAATDATTKANTAKSEAIAAAATDATTKADAAKQAAITAAASDAKSKADTAEANAKKYADDLISWEDLGE